MIAMKFTNFNADIFLWNILSFEILYLAKINEVDGTEAQRTLKRREGESLANLNEEKKKAEGRKAAADVRITVLCSGLA